MEGDWLTQRKDTQVTVEWKKFSLAEINVFQRKLDKKKVCSGLYYKEKVAFTWQKYKKIGIWKVQVVGTGLGLEIAFILTVVKRHRGGFRQITTNSVKTILQ